MEISIVSASFSGIRIEGITNVLPGEATNSQSFAFRIDESILIQSCCVCVCVCVCVYSHMCAHSSIVLWKKHQN